MDERRQRAEARMREVETQYTVQRHAAAQGGDEEGAVGAAGGSVGATHTRRAIELMALRLRSIQRRLRAAVAEAHPLSGLPGPSILPFLTRDVESHLCKDDEALSIMRKTEEQDRGRAEARTRFLDVVVAAHGAFRAHFDYQRKLMKQLCKDVVKEVNKRDRKRQAIIDREKKDRLAALKSDDIAAYRRHIQNSKNERMQLVVARMDEYMEKLGANINKQTAEAAEREGMHVDQSASKEYTFQMPVNEKITEQSSLMGDEGLKLKQYQIEGVNWLVNLYNNQMSGILADEMGLGKTIQVIGMICHLVEHKNNHGPYLVIAPLSTIGNWQNEFERWAPSLSTIVYRGNPNERKELFNQHMKDGKFNVLIVQFELVMHKPDAKNLKSLNWSYVIVDEGHRLKNRESKLFSMLTGKNGYKSKHRVILSGTPLQNEIFELWSLLNFLLPEIFDTCDDFEEWFAKPFKMAEGGDEFEVEEEEKEFLIKCLHAVLRPFMTRRLKADLKDIMELPETREATILCELSALQRILYLQTENHLLMQQDADGGARQKKMTNRTSQLRKVCNHPFLFEEYNFGDQFLIRSCGKLALLDRILPKLQRGGHRVLIYSQMVKLLHILQSYCHFRQYQHMILSGETASEDRIAMMQRWNAPDSKYFIFMLSTRAGGQGINLQTADTVIIYDSDWNPMMDEQAKARVHRLGQTKQTLVLRLVTPNTVEEKVTKRAAARLQNEDLAIEAGKFNQRTEVAESHELLKQKLAQEFQEKMEAVREQAHTDEQINELIARTPEEIELFNKIDEDERKTLEMSVRKGSSPPLARLMTEDEVPSWLQGDPIFIDNRVLCLSSETSTDLLAGDGLTGVVVGVPTSENSFFQVRVDGAKDSEIKQFPRSRLRLMTHEMHDRYREDLGYGRGQRESQQVSHTGRVDFSKMTDKQFDRHMREADEEDDVRDAAKKKKRKRKINDAGIVGSGTEDVPLPGAPPRMAPGSVVDTRGLGLSRSPDKTKSAALPSIPRKKPKVEGGQGGHSLDSLAVPSDPDGNSERAVAEPGAGRHSKYDPNALAPWKGGDVKPYLYGRRVVFVLAGRRLPPCTR